MCNCWNEGSKMTTGKKVKIKTRTHANKLKVQVSSLSAAACGDDGGSGGDGGGDLAARALIVEAAVDRGGGKSFPRCDAPDGFQVWGRGNEGR